MPPKRLGRWTVLEPIGRGGQSRVYQALDTEGGALRALKHVATFTAQKRRRFVREVRRHVTLSDASARNIVPIIDHNLDEFEAGARNGYIVMPSPRRLWRPAVISLSVELSSPYKYFARS